MKRNIVVAITGASGVTYALRLLEVLGAAGCDVHLIISPAAQAVLKQELDLTVDLENFNPAMLMLDGGPNLKDRKLQTVRALAGISSDSSNVLAVGTGEDGKLHYYHYRDYLAAIASGSFLTDGMVICPCSSGTLSAIVHGTSAQPDPPGGRSPLEGAAEADSGAARNAAVADPAGQYAAGGRGRRHHPARHARLLSRRQVHPRPGGLHRGADLRPIGHRKRADPALGSDEESKGRRRKDRKAEGQSADADDVPGFFTSPFRLPLRSFMLRRFVNSWR